ncbi:GTPase LSG1-2 [Glycine max]|nr:GTPase LSG1-2 [Glycine max]
MGKKQNEIQKTGLGRALVKQHNQMIQQSKDKSRFYRKKFLESFTEVFDIDAVVEQSLEPLPELAAVASTTLINLEPGFVPDETTTPEEARKQQKQEEALHTSSLRVPHRSPWTPNMSADELNNSETQAFLTWRHSLASATKRLKESDIVRDSASTFAKVKFARNSETGEPVALKILDKEKVLKHKMAEQVEYLSNLGSYSAP